MTRTDHVKTLEQIYEMCVRHTDTVQDEEVRAMAEHNADLVLLIIVKGTPEEHKEACEAFAKAGLLPS